MDSCRYIKAKDGWYNVETGNIIPYGETILEFYLFFHKMITDYHDETDILHEELSNKYKNTLLINTPEYKQLEKKYPLLIEYYDVIHEMDSIIGIYLEQNNLEITGNKWNIKNDSFYSSEEQSNSHKKHIDRAKECGWLDISDNEDISLIDMFLLRENNNIKPNITTCFINHQWYTAYIFGNDDYSSYLMAMLDLQELRNHDDIDFAVCMNCINPYHYCDNIFIKHGKQLYCEECRSNYKKDYDDKIKHSVYGMHDKVRQLMKNSGRFTLDERQAFLDESNYYKNVIKGKNPENINNYRDDIKTLGDYGNWLNQKHKEYKKY